MKSERVAAYGSVASGVLASACCIVPLALAFLGVSGGALALGFEPYRPYLLVAAYGLLGAAFYLSTHHPEVTPRHEDGAARNRLWQVAEPPPARLHFTPAPPTPRPTHPLFGGRVPRGKGRPRPYLRGAQKWREKGHGIGRLRPGDGCATSSPVRGGRSLLWFAALAVILTTAFPWYARFLPL